MEVLNAAVFYWDVSDRTFFMWSFLTEEFLMGFSILYMRGRFYFGSFAKTDINFYYKSGWIFGFNNRQNGGSWLCLEIEWSLYKYGKWFYYKRMTCWIGSLKYCGNLFCLDIDLMNLQLLMDYMMNRMRMVFLLGSINQKKC